MLRRFPYVRLQEQPMSEADALNQWGHNLSVHVGTFESLRESGPIWGLLH